METNLTAARHEVDEEIRLASEQKANHGRELEQLECGTNERHRSDHLVEARRSRMHRSLQQKEITASRLFRSLQLVDMAEQKELQIQKAVKEEGTLPIFAAPLATKNLACCRCRRVLSSNGSRYQFSV